MATRKELAVDFLQALQDKDRRKVLLEKLWNMPKFVAAAMRENISFRYASDSLKNNKTEALNAVDRNGDFFVYLSDTLKKDLDVVMTALKRTPAMAAYIDPLLLEKEEFWSRLLTTCEAGTIFSTLEALHKQDMFNAIKYKKPPLGFTSKIPKKLIPEFIKQSGRCLKYFSQYQQDRTLVDAALLEDISAIQYAHASLFTKDDILKLVSQQKTKPVFRDLPKSFKEDKEIVAAAIKEDPYLIRYIDTTNHPQIISRELALEIVQYNGKLLENLPVWCKQDKDIVDAALENDSYAIQYVDKNSLENDKNIVSRSRILEILETDGMLLENLPGWCKKDEKIVSLAYGRNPKSIKYANPEIFTKDFVLKFVQENLIALRDIPSRYKADKKILSLALGYDLYNLCYLNDALKNDNQEIISRDSALKAVKKDGELLKYLPDWCKKDKDIINAACSQGLNALKYVHDKVLMKEIAIEALKKDLNAITALPAVVTEDDQIVSRELALQIVNKSGRLLEYLPSWCKKDKEIVTAALKNTIEAIAEVEDVSLITFEHAMAVLKENINLVRYLPEKFKTDPTILSATLPTWVTSSDASGLTSSELCDLVFNYQHRIWPGYFHELQHPLIPPLAPKTLDTTKHFKIWFSANKDEALGMLNKFRLIRHREKYPHGTLSLVVDMHLLSESAQKDLTEFSKDNNIQLVTLEDIEKQLTDPLDLKLMEIAKAEIRSPYGNLAAGSDIIRLLARGLGIYSDMDSSVVFEQAKLQISDVLVDISAGERVEDFQTGNDIYAFPEEADGAAHPLRTMLKEYILYQYLDQMQTGAIEDFLKQRKSWTTDQIRYSILETSGPGALLKCLSRYIQQYYEHYGVALCDVSKHATVYTGEDNAWLHYGATQLRATNMDMENKLKTIQRAFRDMRDEKIRNEFLFFIDQKLAEKEKEKLQPEEKKFEPK